MRQRLENPLNDDEEPDDFWDLKYDFGTFLNKKLCPVVLNCETDLFPMCIRMGANEEYIDNVLKLAKSPKPDFTKYDIHQVIEYINNSLEFRSGVIELLNRMVNTLKGSLADIAIEVESKRKNL